MDTAPRARIALSALAHNLELAKRRAPGSRLLAMVKANAYGHGLEIVAGALAGQVDGFGVARLEEALQLRQAGIGERIVLLDAVGGEELLELCVRHRLDLAVHEPSVLESVCQGHLPGPLRLWLKLDTGMHRLGLERESFITARRELQAHPRVEELLCMTHLACAGERDEAGVQEQLRALHSALEGAPGPCSAANSAALLHFPEARLAWVRPGMMLYGATPFSDLEPHPELRPVMQLEAPLLSIRTLAPGEAVGYGACWRAERPSRIGTVAIGYGDGYPCPPDGQTLPALLEGRPCQVVGRVSMDMLGVDLSDCPDARPGQFLRLWGEGMPVENVARASGRSVYELLAGLSVSVQRTGED